MSFNVKMADGVFDRDRFLRLTAQVCEESISDGDFRELEQTLRSSVEARELFREYMNFHVTLGSCFGAAAQSVAPGQGEERVLRKGAQRVQRVAFRRRAILAAAAAITIGIGVGVYALLTFRNTADSSVTAGAASASGAAASPATGNVRDPGMDLIPDPATASGVASPVLSNAADSKRSLRPWLASMPADGLAVVKDLIDVNWPEKARRFPKNQWISANGTVAIEKGLIRLRFREGATVTLRGPAKLRILSGNSASLDYGEIYSNVPPSANGFTVITPPMKVIDVGTAFGVTADKDGEVEVHVYEGEVHLQAPDEAPQAFEGVKKLLEGDALRARAPGKTPRNTSPNSRETAFEKVEFGAPVFRRLQSVNAGLLNISKLVNVSDRAPVKHLREYENNRLLYVFQERRRVQLDEPVKVAFSDPGHYYNAADNTLPVGEGATVRSYLLQFNPVGKQSKGHSFKGSLTFDQPIVGVITEAGRLIETDAIFAPDMEFYRNFTGRTLDINPHLPAAARGSGDKVTLGESRRTLQLDWTASSGIDQIRVLVLDETF